MLLALVGESSAELVTPWPLGDKQFDRGGIRGQDVLKEDWSARVIPGRDAS